VTRTLACLLAVTLLALLLPPTTTASAQATVRDCGHMPNHLAYGITSRKFPCRRAKQVVRHWGKTAAQTPGGDGWVLGLYCRFRSVGHEAGVIRCSRRGRVVRWETGS